MTFRYEYYLANINRAQNCTVLYPIGIDILNSNFAHPFWGANLLKHSLRNEWKSFLLFFLYMKSYNKMVYPPNLYALLYNSFPPFWGKLIIII